MLTAEPAGHLWCALKRPMEQAHGKYGLQGTFAYSRMMSLYWGEGKVTCKAASR